MEHTEIDVLDKPQKKGFLASQSNEAYTIDEVARICRCEPETVVVRIEAGDIPGLKLGRGWIIPCEAFKQRLNELALEEAHNRRRLRKAGPATVKAIQIASSKNGRSRTPPPLPAMPLSP